MQKITIIGTGYVGLVTGACFAGIGHEVVCMDKDSTKIDLLRQGRSPIYEAGLEELINENRDHFRFTTNMAEALDGCNFAFLAVGTPTAEEGRAETRYICEAATEVGKNLRHDGVTVVVKSTVPVGMNGVVKEIIRNNLPAPVQFRMASCPEFLREGTAVKDVFEADRVVIGTDSIEDFDQVASLYTRFGSKIIHTDIASAEMIKYASNSFLATKITFINEVANLCERVGADIDHVARGMGLDSRIGPKFLQAGIGYGGSCFPKDTLAMLRTAEDLGYDFAVLRKVIEVNSRQAGLFLDKVLQHCGSASELGVVAVWGLSFKPGTDDVRESPSLHIVSQLAAHGFRLRLYDPAGMDNFRREMPNLACEYAESATEAAERADMLLILTEWEEFVGFPLQRLSKLMGRQVIFDGRNCFSRRAAQAHGFTYYSVGRPDVTLGGEPL